MAVGRLHIFELDRQATKGGGVLRQYQVNYNDPGNNFSGAMTEEKLREFLRLKATLTPAALESTLRELHNTGHATVAAVELAETEAASIGLVQRSSQA